MPIPTFTLHLTVEGAPAQVWERLWDLDRHTAAIPLTETTSTSGPLGAGATFVARTGLGTLGFDDRMVVRRWEPPRHAVIEKVGRILTGRIEVTLDPAGPDRTELRWRQRYGVSHLPDRLAGLARPAVAAAYRGALRRITRA
ncbi:hypothetical protein ACQBAT_01610 [Ornithinimicrobium sp. Y1847]|uniref:hypothetical protein n=1 Tax=unclassified Ornithinimicrobium TaxID=2615080 RepID=UPI003B67DA77